MGKCHPCHPPVPTWPPSDGAYSLIGGDALSDGERDALLELCRQRLDAFRGVQASYGHREAGCVFCALELIAG
jgi:hypothetical protein